MGAALAGLLILSVMLTGSLMFWRVTLVGNDRISTAQKQMIQLEGTRARTEIDVSSSGSKSCRTLVINLLNEGHTSVSKSAFPWMDIIIHFTGTSDPSQALTYEPLGLASLDKGEWIDTSISGQFEPSVWNPGETLKIEAQLQDFSVLASGTLVVSTPNGIIDTHTLSYLPTPPGCDWYFHSETTAVGGSTYYQLKEGASADGTAATISAPIAAVQTGRIRPTSNIGKSVFPLTGLLELNLYDWDVTYRVQRDLLDMGFVWHTNARDISLTTTGSWQDIDLSLNGRDGDCSGLPLVPVGATREL